MVDTRLKGEWLSSPRFEDLSDTAWRVFTMALMWSNNQGEDGRIPLRSLNRLHPDGPQPEAVADLVAAGLLSVDGDDCRLVGDWKKDLGQSPKAEIDAQREKNRQKQQEYRDRINGLKSAGETNDVTGNEVGYVGQARNRSSLTEEEGKKDDEFFFGPEPSPFCAQHSPAGPNGASCKACMDARSRRDYWKSNRPSRSMQNAQLYKELYGTDYAGHIHRRADPEDRYCCQCGERIEELEEATH